MRVLSIDPGTRNLARCLLEYDNYQPPPTTVEEFLARICVIYVRCDDLGTAHVATAMASFACIPYEYIVDYVVIEQQGSPRSPVVNMCYALYGFYLAKGCCVHIDYPASNKFRGPWVRVGYNSGSNRLALVDTAPFERDPVKRASVVCAERLLTHVTTLTTDVHAALMSMPRRHDMCDSFLQGVAFLYTALGFELPVGNAFVGDDALQVESILQQTRASRTSATQTRTTTVVGRRRRALRTDNAHSSSSSSISRCNS